MRPLAQVDAICQHERVLAAATVQITTASANYGLYGEAEPCAFCGSIAIK